MLIESIDDEFKDMVKEMFALMYATKGIGLAAPQVGINRRFMVYNEEAVFDPTHPEKEKVFINPFIIRKSDKLVRHYESCLSFDRTIEVRIPRHEWIDVEYKNMTGLVTVERLQDIPAIVFQHEYDHLDKVSRQTSVIGEGACCDVFA